MPRNTRSYRAKHDEPHYQVSVSLPASLILKIDEEVEEMKRKGTKMKRSALIAQKLEEWYKEHPQ